LKKELGEIKTVRRNIARVLTATNAKKKTTPPAVKSETPKAEVKEEKTPQ
jgi:hypothetical protein